MRTCTRALRLSHTSHECGTSLCKSTSRSFPTIATVWDSVGTSTPGGSTPIIAPHSLNDWAGRLGSTFGNHEPRRVHGETLHPIGFMVKPCTPRGAGKARYHVGYWASMVSPHALLQCIFDIPLRKRLILTKLIKMIPSPKDQAF